MLGYVKELEKYSENIIKDFLVNLWHSSDESDIDDTLPVIVILGDGNVMKVRYMKQGDIFVNGDSIIERKDVVKFCYFRDLVV